MFASQLAHSLTLHIESHGGPNPGTADLPVRAEASLGGFVLEQPAAVLPEGDLTGTLRGKWGFDNWEGPHFHLEASAPAKWTLAAGDQSALVVGREDTLHLESESSLCVERVEEQLADGSALKLAWKAPKPETLEVSVPLKGAIPGPVNLQIYKFGLEKPDRLALTAYAEAASLERFTLCAGDTDAVLKGNRLDEVEKVVTDGITWIPATLSRVQDADLLAMTTEGPTANLEAGKRYFAAVQLRDGRQLKAPVTVELPRPQATLLSKGTQNESSDAVSPVRLGSPDDLPLGERLVFFFKSRVPASFRRDEKVEVAAADDSFRAVLTLADGSLMLEDAKTAIGTLEPLARFGPSAFGPVPRVSARGGRGDRRLGSAGNSRAAAGLQRAALSASCGQVVHTTRGRICFWLRQYSATTGTRRRSGVPPGFYGNAADCAPPGQRDALFEIARRSIDRADAYHTRAAGHVTGSADHRAAKPPASGSCSANRSCSAKRACSAGCAGSKNRALKSLRSS